MCGSRKFFKGEGVRGKFLVIFYVNLGNLNFPRRMGGSRSLSPPPLTPSPPSPPPHTHTWWGSTKGDTSHILCMEYMAFMWLQLTHNLAGDKLLLFIIADPEVFLCCRHLVKWLPSRWPLCVVSHSRVRLQSASATLFVYSSVCFYILFCSFLCFCKYF